LKKINPPKEIGAGSVPLIIPGRNFGAGSGEKKSMGKK